MEYHEELVKVDTLMEYHEEFGARGHSHGVP